MPKFYGGSWDDSGTEGIAIPRGAPTGISWEKDRSVLRVMYRPSNEDRPACSQLADSEGQGISLGKDGIP